MTATQDPVVVENPIQDNASNSIPTTQVVQPPIVDSTEFNTATGGDASGVGIAAQGAQPSAASLYVGDLQPFVAEKELYEFFSTVGEVASVRVCRDAITRRSLCYAYVNFANYPDGEKALKQLNYCPIAGKPCRLMWSQRDPSARKSGSGNVFIKNLDPNINNKGLDEVFKVFGNILSCKVYCRQGAVSGVGYVHYETKESADRAIEAFNGVYFNDRKVCVCYHLPKRSRDSMLAAMRSNFTNIYVKNLAEDVTSKDLRDLFSAHGEVVSAVVSMTPNETSRGFGFVNFESHESASNAVDALHNSDFHGMTLHVCRAQKKQEREETLRKDFEVRRQEWFQKFQGSNLYVKNLDDDFDDDKLRAEFAPYGTITSCKVMVDEKGISRGFGFVCFSSAEEATKAANELNGRIISKKPLYVAIAQRKDQRHAQLQARYSQSAHLQQFHPSMQAMHPPAMLHHTPMYSGAPLYYSPVQPSRGNGPYYNPAAHNGMRTRWTQPGTGQGMTGYPMNAQYQSGHMNNGHMGHMSRNSRGPRGQQHFQPAMQHQIGGAGNNMGHSGVGSNSQVRGGPQRVSRSTYHPQFNGAQQNFRYGSNNRPFPPDAMNVGPVMGGVSHGTNIQPTQANPLLDVSIGIPGENSGHELQSQQNVQQMQSTTLHGVDLNSLDHDTQKQMIGEALYQQIKVVDEHLAPKITGMLLEMGNDEVMNLLKSPGELQAKIEEASMLLKGQEQSHQMQSQRIGEAQ